MAKQQPIYDLVLLLDGAAEEEVRAKIIADATAAIQADGEIVGTHAWGTRPLAFEIDKKKEAVYHLIQLHAASRELLAHLQRTLSINDGVIRFRIVKLEPGTPPPPDMSKTALVFEPEPDSEAELRELRGR
jgi:small subunit ribosomal protein S6